MNPSLLGAVHGLTEVVDEVRVDLEDDGLGEGGDEDVAYLLVLVPVLDGLGEGDAEEEVALQDLGHAVEEHVHFGGAQDRRTALFQRPLVILQVIYSKYQII